MTPKQLSDIARLAQAACAGPDGSVSERETADMKNRLKHALEAAHLTLADAPENEHPELGPATVTGAIVKVDRDTLDKLFAKLGLPPFDIDEDDDEADKEDETVGHLRALALEAHAALAHIESDALAHRWDEIHGIAVDGRNTVTRLVHTIDELDD